MKCGSCGTEVAPDFKYCDKCGNPLDSSSQQRNQTATCVKTVGTDPSCDIALHHETISRKHAAIEISTSEIRIADLGSSNGTYVNGKRIDSIFVSVKRTDSVRLGLHEFDFGSIGHAELIPSRYFSSNVVIGRSDECDIVLNHPQVSGRHARAIRNSGGYLVEDLGSRNGTFLNGMRIRGAVQMRAGDKLSVASIPVVLDSLSGSLAAREVRGSIQLDVERIRRSIVTDNGEQKQLLSEMSFSIGPGELVGVMGQSGAGKSTLLTSLCGMERPSAGKVLLNGTELYSNFESFRHIVGFVPQDDVLHPELTVQEAILFAARLRLPEDTSDVDIQSRVNKIIHDLKLNDVRDVRIGSSAEKKISGGQRKRVNLGVELVGEPELIFLDEPTSGLSSQDALEVLSVLQDFSRSGKTIVLTIHQPSLEIFGMMSRIIFLVKGGRLAFFGATGPDVFNYFESSARTPENLMRILESRPAEEWEARYRRFSAQPLGDMLQSSMPASMGKKNKVNSKRPRLDVSSTLQTKNLIHRYAITKLRDKSNLLFLALQAPVVGLMLALLFGEGRNDYSARDIPLFISGIAVLFFGAFNASREIVRERVIFQRESLVFLRSFPYFLSKFILLNGVALLQNTILLALVSLFVGLQGSFIEYFIVLAMTSLSAIALGLLISSLVRSVEAAMTIVPIVIILHIVLAGFLKPLDSENQEHVGILAAPFISRWNTEALMEVERRGLSIVSKPTKSDACEIAGESAEAMHWCLLHAQIPKGYRPHRLQFDFLVLGALSMVFLAGSTLSLRMRR